MAPPTRLTDKLVICIRLAEASVELDLLYVMGALQEKEEKEEEEEKRKKKKMMNRKRRRRKKKRR